MRTKRRKTKTNRGTGTGVVWVPRKDRIGEFSRRSADGRGGLLRLISIAQHSTAQHICYLCLIFLTRPFNRRNSNHHAYSSFSLWKAPLSRLIPLYIRADRVLVQPLNVTQLSGAKIGQNNLYFYFSKKKQRNLYRKTSILRQKQKHLFSSVESSCLCSRCESSYFLFLFSTLSSPFSALSHPLLLLNPEGVS
jgi:hypothetical protein